jgi:two-component system NtrC family sensor kinase
MPPFAFRAATRYLTFMARISGGHASRPKPSLKTELLFNLAVLAAGALLLAVVSSALAPLLGHGLLGSAFLVFLVAADLVIFVAFGAYLVSRLITKPMDALVDATGAVAAGELGRRAPAGETRELDRLAESVNRMTERLLDAQGALVRAAKLASVGRLAAGVAHEVGNPLAAIDNYVELLRRRGVEPELVAALARETGRIDAIVRSLLDYARPRDAAREPLDVGSVVAGAVELLRTQGVLRAVTVELTGPPDLPRVLGDRMALEQVFVNLLLNAVDAAGDGGRIAVVTGATSLGREEEQPQRASDSGPMPLAGLRVRRRGGGHLEGTVDGAPAVRVLVADSGPGVPPELAARVFEPFFTTKPPGSGTGLGLAIVQRIVEDHGGRVDVAAAREGGAGFTVTLPALEP